MQYKAHDQQWEILKNTIFEQFILKNATLRSSPTGPYNGI